MKYEDIFTFSNLMDAAKECYKNVMWKGSVQAFKANDVINVYKIMKKLEAPTYKSMPFHSFTIHERGKTRNIKSQHISERVMQKCLCRQFLLPLLEPKLIYDNGACRLYKGISFARKRFMKHLRAYWMQHGTQGYVLTFDFSKYFDSINHTILLDMLEPMIEDKRVFNLIKTLIHEFGDKGLGLGSEISQILALYFPNKIDRYIKEVAKCKYYGRYMDDGYIIHHDKDYLIKLKSEIIEVAKTLDIKINENKTQIHKLTHPIVWLKIRYTLTDTGRIVKKPWPKNISRMRTKLKKLYVKGVPEESIDNSYASWEGCMQQCHAYRTMKNIDEFKKELSNDYKRTNK